MLTEGSKGADPGCILIQGAREHNLKNLSLEIPRGRFVVITGVSGSGKSTLAFDLLFAEGQRRFLDAMNAYARQFVEQMARPDVDLIAGLPPTVSIEQRNSQGGGKSTVATVTEIHHFLRLLFARLGLSHCPECRQPVETQTRDEVGQRLLAEARQRGELRVLARVVKHRKGFHSDVAEWAVRHGFAEIRADGKLQPAGQPLRLDRFREHDVEVVAGRVPGKRSGRADAGMQAMLDKALELGGGVVLALDSRGRCTVHSTERVCGRCGRSFERLDPKHFSYHSPQGWCPRCRGFGELFYLPEVERGARADAIEESWFGWQEGRREPCPDCGGMRLNPVARAVRLPGRNTGRRRQSPREEAGPTIDEFSRASVDEAQALVRAMRYSGVAGQVARDILPEIRERLRFLAEVGLGYLQLGRGVPTLSGGEAQRIRLAAQLGSNLSGVLYVLDEPTIGLHARDNDRLLDTLVRLRARGNSVIVVEHDEATMRRADWIVDLGPGAGTHGGEVVACGTFAQLSKHEGSITGRSLRDPRCYPSRGRRRPVRAADPHLVLAGASVHNLRDLTVCFPVGRLIGVTGVSGSGKSSLVRECLLPAVQAALKRKPGPVPPGTSGTLRSGREWLQAVYEVNQSPIGRTPRSTPATYVGFFDAIRALFAQLPEARLRGYSAGRFSFNSPAGRCPACDGAGSVKLEMSFLPPAFVRCEACDGHRFSRETLDVEFHGLNIAQVLDLTVEGALEVFGSFTKIRRPLEALRDTGLGYLRLGQTSPTLSGGEAQRVKLVSHLVSGMHRPALREDLRPARNLFLLEEPTIGLHMTDVRLLVGVLQRLVEAGHTVVVIEHNLELIAEADWVIDLGPEGGGAGGGVVATGTPEAVAGIRGSHTGRYLRAMLGNASRRSGRSR